MSNHVTVIAEIGVNHNGSISMAKEMIRVAAEAGADYAKFQTFSADQLATASAPKAAYQKESTSAAETQREMLSKLALSDEDHHELIECCKKNNIAFLSSPFSNDSLAFLVDSCRLTTLKIPSGELTNSPLLLQAGASGCKIILSTGMADLNEIHHALGVIAFGALHIPRQPSLVEFEKAYDSAEGKEALRDKVVILHCTTQYPTPVENINLQAMDVLRETFSLPVGFSDHSAGVLASIAAAARGAVVIEKHFTLDKSLPGPDHKASLEPSELQEMIAGIRYVEKANGMREKVRQSVEHENVMIARKSLVALTDIKEGDIFTHDNLGAMRPGTGLSPMFFWDYLGESAVCHFKAGELIT